MTVPAANGSAIKAVSVDWGDGSAQELGSVTGNSVVSHVYKDAASYLIKASATDASGNTVSVSTVVTVVQAPQPTIIITYSPVPAKVNTTTTITIQVTVPSGLGVLNTTLDFGDGTDPSGLGGAVNATQPHVYTVQKTYTVTVTVKTTNNVTTTGTTAIAVGL